MGLTCGAEPADDTMIILRLFWNDWPALIPYLLESFDGVRRDPKGSDVAEN
jgi:hypothetical protein